MRRHELTDREWALIAECLPARKAKGRKPPDFRRIHNGIFWILGTGAPWRDLPERYGPRSTVHGWFSRWSKDGTIDRIMTRLQMRLDAEGHIDWALFAIDGSVVRASRAAAGARKKGAQKPKTKR